MDEQTKELYRQTKMAWERGYQVGAMYSAAIAFLVLLALVIIFK